MLVLHDLELWVERCLAALCSLTVTLVLEPGVKVIPELTDQSRDTSANRSWLRAVPHKVMYFSNIFTTSWNGGWVILTEFYLCSSRFFFCSLRRKKNSLKAPGFTYFTKPCQSPRYWTTTMRSHVVPKRTKPKILPTVETSSDKRSDQENPSCPQWAVSEVILEEGTR